MGRRKPNSGESLESFVDVKPSLKKSRKRGWSGNEYNVAPMKTTPAQLGSYIFIGDDDHGENTRGEADPAYLEYFNSLRLLGDPDNACNHDASGGNDGVMGDVGVGDGLAATDAAGEGSRGAFCAREEDDCAIVVLVDNAGSEDVVLVGEGVDRPPDVVLGEVRGGGCEDAVLVGGGIVDGSFTEKGRLVVVDRSLNVVLYVEDNGTIRESLDGDDAVPCAKSECTGGGNVGAAGGYDEDLICLSQDDVVGSNADTGLTTVDGHAEDATLARICVVDGSSAKNGRDAVNRSTPLDDDHIDVETPGNGNLDTMYASEDIGMAREFLDDGIVGGVNHVNARCVVDDDIDPDYKMFLGMLRENGNAYAFEVSLADGVSLVTEYETTDDKYGGCDRCRPETMRDSQKKKSMEADMILNNCTRTNQIENQSGSTRGQKGLKRKSRDVSESKVKSSLHMKRRAEPLACRVNVQSNNLHAENGVISEDLVDESYKIILSSLIKDGNQLVFDLKTSEKLIYEQDEESSPDSDIMILDTDPFLDANSMPFVILDDDDVDNGCCFESSCRNNGSQNEMLMEILKKPYDEYELNDLSEKFKCRKPKVGCRQMRKRDITYPMETMGQSYEDQYRDLAEKIRSERSKAKVLNLYRGFFYWLQNLVHGSMAPPWMDPFYLEVLPAEISPDYIQRSKVKVKHNGFKIVY